MGDNTKGLYNKCSVERTDGGNQPDRKHHGCQYFPLDLTHDRHAVPAILAYALSCEAENPTLAGELRQKAHEIGGGDAVTLSTYNAEVHRWMNHNMFADILEATEAEARACGFYFIKGESDVDIPSSVKQRLGSAALRAKYKHVSPLRSSESIEELVSSLLEDGDALAWGDGILAALKAQGLAVAKLPMNAHM